MTPNSQGGFPENAFEYLASVEPGNYWFESRNRLIVWALRRYFPQATTFLDAGCGTGFVLQGIHAAWPSLKLSAVDAAGNGVDVARSRVPSASFYEQDLREFNPGSQFDVVGAFDVLEHIPEDEAVLATFRRLVTSSGGLIVTVPQHPQLWSRSDDVARHVRRYTRREMIDRVMRAGFDVVLTTSFVSLLLPVLAVERWLDNRRKTPFEGQLRVSRAANAGLGGVLAVERAAIRAGLRFPAGGSLLVAARARS